MAQFLEQVRLLVLEFELVLFLVLEFVLAHCMVLSLEQAQLLALEFELVHILALELVHSLALVALGMDLHLGVLDHRKWQSNLADHKVSVDLQQSRLIKSIVISFSILGELLSFYDLQILIQS
eukprot:NODE_45_length_32908_cov_0.790271.p28 type:complete len:123 gc:universal NODE_45_length_32908_cov_0.790271:5014-4646(-)